jgi:hypothetical protein
VEETGTPATIPTSGRGAIQFALFALDSDEAGRATFERLVTDLVKVVHPSARAVKANPGDWGIDTLVGTLAGGTIHVWQSKFWMDGIGESQQAQIRESFRSLMQKTGERKLDVKSWTLCIPAVMDPEMTAWWDKWSGDRALEYGIEIGLWDETELRGMLIKLDFEDVRGNYFGYPPGHDLQNRLVDEPATPEEYDSALFVKQLHEANIEDDMAARRAFFNAEVMTRDINEREVERELHALHEVRATLHQIWHTRYVRCTTEGTAPNGLLPALYPDTMVAVESYHQNQPSRVLRDTLVHRTGIVHHLAEDGQLGWVRHYAQLAQDHLEQTRAS